jgi:hypothetical protein
MNSETYASVHDDIILGIPSHLSVLFQQNQQHAKRHEIQKPPELQSLGSINQFPVSPLFCLAQVNREQYPSGLFYKGTDYRFRHQVPWVTLDQSTKNAYNPP